RLAENKDLKAKNAFIDEITPYALGFLLALAVLFLVRWGFLCPGYEYEPDCFYHARIVEEGPSVFMAKKFPNLISSTWCEHFSDKELGFHLILWVVTRIGKLLGATNEYPFHYQVMFFDALLLAFVAYALYRCKIKFPWIYMLLLSCVFPPMTFRLVSLRAYLLSITIATVLISMFLDERFCTWRWRYLALLAMGFIAAWSYSSPHLLIFTIAPFAIADYLKARNLKALLATPAAFLLGIVLGLTIHPQFPNTYLMFKVQCIDVIIESFLKMGKVPLEGGEEFYTNTFELIRNHYYLYLVLPVTVIVLAIKYKETFFGQDWLKNNVFNGLLLTAVVNTLLSYKVFRFSEYALVPQCLLLAYAVNKVLETKDAANAIKKDTEPQEQEDKKPQSKPITRRAMLFTVMLVYTLTCLGALFWYTSHLVSQGMGELPALGVAQWVEDQKLPEGTVIANFMWPDFPRLYYALPKYRFNWGLDPSFTWRNSPELMDFIKRASKREKLTPADFKKAYKARYIYVYILQYECAQCCWENGLIPIYENWDGYIFDLDLPAREITSSTPKLQFLDLVKQGKGAAYVMQYCLEKMYNYYGVPIEKK
ncbi:MAG: hypothetical protein IJS08_11640, partial [Victivallales bacterium]|nr:hypothetical protein [Victivallales bacterium]